MNVFLPVELTEFINKEVKAGLYENASDVVRDALRRLRERDHLLRGFENGLSSASTSQYDQSISSLGAGDGDIMAMAFMVLMQAAKDAREDLKMIMAEVKAITATKQKLRELISKVNRDIAANVSQKDKQPAINFSRGMGSEEAYHQVQMPIADPESKDGLKFVPTNLYNDHLDDVAQLKCIQEDLKGQLDSMSDMSQMTSLRLQMAMDQRSKFISTLSNILKKIDATQDTLIQNLK